MVFFNGEVDKFSFALISDWNGSKRGHVYKFLRSQGFVSSYDTAHCYTDSDADAHRVIILSLLFIYFLLFSSLFLPSCSIYKFKLYFAVG